MKNHGIVPTLLLAMATLVAAGCSSSSTTPAATANTGGASNAYVSNADPSIYGYTAASSSSTLSSTINGPTNDSFIGVATDASGNLYTIDKSTASGSTTYTVNEYAAGSNSTGGATTTTLRTFTSTAFTSAPTSLTVDQSGNIYVMLSGGTLVRFASSSSGSVSASATLTGLVNVSTNVSVMATDSAGNLYVTIPVSLTDNHNIIAVYSSGYASGAASLRTIIPATEINITSLGVDASGNIYATGKDANGNIEVAVFSSTSTGTSTATRVISGASTTMMTPWQVQVDGSGNVFVGDSSNGAVGGTAVVYKFAASATGNVSPSETITTSATYAATTGLAIH
ncbi:MAG TPA: hypothetical protein VMQ60_02460 [Acidobacteriaceae bacterium]|nr:hypothetical protein [Acidobacteriaceae bacterium]